MELLTEKPRGKGRITWASVQLFGKMVFLEDAQYLVHCRKMSQSTARLPGVPVEGSQGSAAAVHTDPGEFCRGGRAWATAFLFPRAAAVQPTPEHCFFYMLFNMLLLTCPVLEAASHCNPFRHYYRNGQGFHHRNLHRVWIITLLCNSSPRTSCSPQSGLFCSCRINPLAHDSLQKKHPLNFQLNFSPITSARPPRAAPRAGSAPPAPRPHGNRAERLHGNEGAGKLPLFHLWKYFKIAKNTARGEAKKAILKATAVGAKQRWRWMAQR